MKFYNIFRFQEVYKHILAWRQTERARRAQRANRETQTTKLFSLNLRVRVCVCVHSHSMLESAKATHLNRILIYTCVYIAIIYAFIKYTVNNTRTNLQQKSHFLSHSRPPENHRCAAFCQHLRRRVRETRCSPLIIPNLSTEMRLVCVCSRLARNGWREGMRFRPPSSTHTHTHY